MAYTHAKGALRPHFTGFFDINADSVSALKFGIGMIPNDATSRDDSDSEFEDD